MSQLIAQLQSFAPNGLPPQAQNTLRGLAGNFTPGPGGSYSAGGGGGNYTPTPTSTGSTPAGTYNPYAQTAKAL